ncbi:MAG: hypothetical protein K8J31_24770, partial [Anaerolineae bacterium]|nr:hypothetical protein [Anaerolineae bacterium]
MRLRTSLILCLLLLGTILFAPRTPVIAQDTCPVLVQTALEQMGQNCSGVGLNSACYGYTRVDSTFVVNTPADFFSQPSDQAQLAQMETISTRPLDLNLDQWGIALMNLRANVPGALPGQATVFMLMGDTEVDNAVPPDAMLPEVDPVETRTTAEARLASGPAANANRVALLASGARIQAQGLSPDGDW